MWAPSVIMFQVQHERLPERLGIEPIGFVDDVCFRAAKPAFHNSVGLRRPGRQAQGREPGLRVVDDAPELIGELGVAVHDDPGGLHPVQEASVGRGQIARDLRHPGLVGMIGDTQDLHLT